jgi:superfamily II DNA or RNA helicase
MEEHSDLRFVDLKSDYNTEEDDIVADLYAPCLQAAIRYDRAVGYFRANIYRELGEPLLDFVLEGGRVRIVCSPDIPEPDEEAAREGYEARGKRGAVDQKTALMKTIDIMAGNPDEKDCLDMLRLLIETNALELFIAVRPGGIYHRKIGVFSDVYGDKVVFSGSGNETARAVSNIEDWGNDEDFDVYRSWVGGFEGEKALKKESHLIKLFLGGTNRTLVRPLYEIERDYLKKFRSHSNYEDCRHGARKRSSRKTLDKKPSFKPYAYQQKAIDAWRKAGYVGMLSMATATGKTITALFAIKEKIENGRLVLILVPSSVLIDQWKKNINEVYPNVPLLLAGGGYNWKTDPFKRIFVAAKGEPRIILSTMDTAVSDDFLAFISQADNPILIADEAHRLGSQRRKKIFDVPFKERLGLSATPERLFDPEGNRALEAVFGVEPVFYLPLGAKVAISDNGPEVPIIGHFLSPYEYHFYPVTLTPEEQEAWDHLTDEIRKLAPIVESPKEKEDNQLYALDDRLKFLLIQRARIVKKAYNKVETALRALKDWYTPNSRWIIYCEDEEQLDAVYEKLASNKLYIDLLKYHSKLSSEERTRALTHFEKYPSVIISIRCLDEGVDVPTADGAIILASSTNPREYIQRRGRVLRKALGKRKADIVDLLVLPKSRENDVPFSIVRSELARAWDFAQTARNRDIIHTLWDICQKYGVDLVNDKDMGIEDEGG